MTRQLYWVIIPAYNESAYLDKVLKKVQAVWSHYIVVDDGSTDNTVKIAQEHTPHVLKHAVNLGKGASLKTGCEYAFSHLGAKGVIFFDADDQHEATIIPKMVKLLESSPVVLGVRAFNNEMPLWKIFLNRIASFTVLIFFGQYIPDIPSGFKALTKEAYKKINWKSVDYLVETEIASRVAQHRIPFSTITIPTIYHDLDRGMTVLDIVGMLTKIISWRFSS